MSSDSLFTVRRRPWWKWFLLLLVLAVGVVLRVHDYGVWQENRGLYFFENEPLLLNADGYHYLRLARDLRDGTYQPIDELRTTPEHPPRPLPPPLLSVLTMAVSALTTLSLPWVAFILPTLLSLSLVIPVFVLCRQLYFPVSASLVAALVAVTSRSYLVRTSLGTYDTDCLIVFFSLSASVLALGFGLCRNRRRYLYLLGAVVNAAFFAWWWDQAPEAVALICLVPLLIGIALFYRPSRREGLIFGAGAAALSGVCLAVVPEVVTDAVQGVREVLVHGIKGATAGFPDVRGDIAELRSVDWGELIEGTTVFFPVLVLGLVGLAWLVWSKPRHAAVALTVPLLLALGTFFFGYRLLIFWGVPVGIGLACLIVAVSRRFEARLPRFGAGVAVAVALLAVVPNAVFEFSEPSAAPRVTSIMPAIPSIREHTPEDAVIWTSWTFGYPIMYFTGRRVIADGQSMSGERRVYVNLPLASHDSVLARNFIRFYVTHGITGLHNLYALHGSTEAGLSWLKRHLGGDPAQAARALFERSAADDTAYKSVETCRAFLFPADVAPVYLLLNHEMLAGKWFWYGTWDAVKADGEASAVLPLFDIKRKGDTLILRDGLTINVHKGGRMTLTVDDGQEFTRRVGKMVTYDGATLQIKDYGHPQGFHFEWMPYNGFGVLATRNVAESLFNRLFIRHTSNPGYFRHVDVRSPSFSLWQVVPGP